MSIIGDKITAFKNKLAVALPDYTIVIAGENGCDGFVNPYMQLNARWNPVDDGTACKSKKILIRVTILIGREYVESNEPGGTVTAEVVESDVEKILGLSIRVPDQEFRVINSMNNDNPTKETEFDVII